MALGLYGLGDITPRGIGGPTAAIIPLAIAVVGVFAYQLVRAPGRLREVEAQRLVDDAIAAVGLEGMLAFLRSSLGAPKLRIRRAYVFGSAAVKHVPPRDIDVVVQFHETTEKRVRNAHSQIKRFARDFERQFSKGLHFQFYLAGEDLRLNQFLVKAGISLQIVGEESPT